MQRITRGTALVGVAGMLLVGGCGLDVTLTGGSNPVRGTTQHFQVKMTNISACPLAGASMSPAFILIPFVPASEVENNTPLQFLCGLGAPPAQMPMTDLATPRDASLDDLRMQVLQLARHGNAAGGRTTGVDQDAVSCSGPGVNCLAESGAALCDLPPFAAGQMLTLTCDAQVPNLPNGKVYNLVFTGLSADGVCKAGAGQGDACTAAADCGMGGTCGQGVCQGGGNNGFGCDSASAMADCPGGGACVLCDANIGLGSACEAAQVGGSAPAPAASAGALAVGLFGLAAVAFLRLRRRMS